MTEREENDYFTTERIKLLLKIFNILIIVIGTMSIIRLIEKNHIQFFVDLFFLISVFIGYFRLRKDHSQYRIITRIIFFSLLLFPSMF
jgi:predicted membrane protein